MKNNHVIKNEYKADSGLEWLVIACRKVHVGILIQKWKYLLHVHELATLFNSKIEHIQQAINIISCTESDNVKQVILSAMCKFLLVFMINTNLHLLLIEVI